MERKRLARTYIVSDFLTASIVWLLFNLLRYKEVASYLGFSSLGSYLSFTRVWEGQLLVPFFWLMVYYISGYYNKPLGKSRLEEFFITFLSILIGVVFLFFTTVLDDIPHSNHIYYELFFFLFGLQFFITYMFRLMITTYRKKKIQLRQYAANVLIIGSGKKAMDIAITLHEQGYRIVGFVKAGKWERNRGETSVKCIGMADDLFSVFMDHRIHEIVVAIDPEYDEEVVNLLYTLYPCRVPIKLYADSQLIFPKARTTSLVGTPLVDITTNNFSEAGKNIKLIIDKFFSLAFLILFSPVLLYIAFRIKRESPGPVFFQQERIGYRGRPFMMYKFRTMYQDSEKKGPRLSYLDDPRITPFGRILRKYRLDELPQFWNVLKGDMSIVGPRPERKFFIDLIVTKAPYYYLLHNVKPGITSWGMVKYGYAGNINQMIERLQYDMLYYENMSLLLDLKILVYTVKTVITGKGI